MNLLVLGPQGAGKGTQAKRIATDYAIPHISTGDMFRAAIAAQTELGQKVEPILASGALVPDDVTIAIIRERLGEEDAEARLRARRLPAQRGAGRRARRDARRDRAAARRGPLLRPPGRRRDGADAQARGGRGPPRRHARGDRQAPRDLPRRDRADRRALPPPGHAGSVARRAHDQRGLRRGPGGAERLEERVSEEGRDHSQVAGRDRAHGGRRRGHRRDARRRRGEARARHLDDRARPDRGRAHPLARRRPDVQGLQGLPGRDVHLAERHDRARHPGRRTRPERATSSRSTSASPRMG